jgi:hypothetical protein
LAEERGVQQQGLGPNFSWGAYTPAQVSALAGVESPAKVRRWLLGDTMGQAALEAFYGTESGVLSFIDLIQIVALQRIRKHRDVPLPRLRDAMRRAKEEYGIDFALARRHRLLKFGRELVLELGEETKQFVQLTGRHRANLLIPKVVEPILKQVAYDPRDGRASRWMPMRGAGCAVVLSPEFNMGAPVVSPGNVGVQALCDVAEGEGSPLRAAVMFGVGVEEVRLAVRFRNRIGKAA